jgi:pimeloyl-ACP methyl ester carboxylesterase
MESFRVETRTRLVTTCFIHRAACPADGQPLVVLHHGICHQHRHFLRLIAALNEQGLHVAMIDQQSKKACGRNGIGLGQYVEGMKAAVEQIEQRTGLSVASYVLHSMGALIGEQLQQKNAALRRPTVLMAPIPLRGALPATLRIMFHRPLGYLWAVLTLNILSLAGKPKHVRRLFFDRYTPEPIVTATWSDLKHAPFFVYLQLATQFLRRNHVLHDGSPRLLLFSPTDYLFERWEYNPTVERYRGSLRIERIEGGHDFFIENADETARRIAEFLAPEDERTLPERQLRFDPAQQLGPPHLRGLRDWDRWQQRSRRWRRLGWFLAGRWSWR